MLLFYGNSGIGKTETAQFLTEKIGGQILRKIGKENRIELHEKLSLTGAEISLNELPAGANVPIVHSHKENEEIYGILSGNGKAIIDGEEISLSTGDWLKIAPAAKRQFFASDISGITYICIQVKRKFSGTFYSQGCRNR